MELQFNKNEIGCLRTLVDQNNSQELTQEVRLLDGMPDIGKILGCWGQTVIRGKEWRSDEMSAGGGIMAWALYEPEEGGEVQCLETWLPFQGKWDLPETQHDGIMILKPCITSMDCRSTNARKIMFRCCIDLQAQAYEPVKHSLYEAETVPPDVQLLKKTYPMELPKEAGEKAFEIRETMLADSAAADIAKILYYQLIPLLNEYKVMADKLVFRGKCLWNLLYMDPDGKIKNANSEFPFSQFAELSDTYGNHASAGVDLILTGVELDKTEDGKQEIRCGMAAQYMIFDREMVTVVEDGYSTERNCELEKEMLVLPSRLDVRKDQLPYRHEINADVSSLVDSAVYWSNPKVEHTHEGASIHVGAFANLLYLDEDGNLSGVQDKWSDSRSLSTDDHTALQVRLTEETPVALNGPDGVTLSSNLQMEISAFSKEEIPMITGMTLGDTRQKEEDRPSVILRKMGDEDIWNIAKAYHTTVQAIENANPLSEDISSESILLIPVS